MATVPAQESAREVPGRRRGSAYRAVILCSLFFFALATIAAVIFYLVTTGTLNRMLTARLDAQGQAFQAVIERRGEDLALLAKDMGVWEELFNYASRPDPSWAAANLEPVSGNNSGDISISGLVVFSRSGEPIFRGGAFRTWPDSVVMEAGRYFAHALDGDASPAVQFVPPVERRLYWLAASRIVHGYDVARQGESAGYIVLAYAMDERELTYAERVSGVRNVRLDVPAQASATATAPARLSLSLPNALRLTSTGTLRPVLHGSFSLQSYLGQPGASLHYDADVPLLSAQIDSWQTGTIVSIGTILLAVFGVLLSTYGLVVRPFEDLSRAVKQFASGGPWQPPAGRHREFQALSGAFTQAIERQLAAEQGERERAAEAAQRAEQLRLLLDSLPALVFFKDGEGRYITVNQGMARFHDLPVDEIIGKSDFDLFPPDVAAEMRAQDRQVLATGERIDGELRLAQRGKEYVFQFVKVPMRDGDGAASGLIGFAFDVSEHRRLEQALRQSQKMEILGQLAGGVAHDFNNVLTAIMAGVEMATAEAPEGSALADDLLEVSQAAERAAQITRQLLFLSRSQSAEKKALDINEVITSLNKMLTRLLGEDISIELDLAIPAPLVLADRTQMEQVLLNLALNARDAMSGGGVLRISTSVHPCCDIGPGRALAPAVKSSGLTPPSGERCLLLTVSDTGFGIPPEVQDHIFEPFFTTKRERGTGLGLSVVHSIVRDHGGAIWFESRPGGGTEFHVALPLAGDAGEATVALPAAKPVPRQARVLLVEDDQAVRALTQRALQRQGYQILVAASASEASGLWQELAQPPDLLLTDVILPDGSGLELARVLESRCPGLRVLFISGYSAASLAERGLPVEGGRLLAKPFTAAALCQAIQETLGA